MATFLLFFLRRGQSCKRNMISLVAMGTEMDEDVSRFSGCLVAARVSQRACLSARASALASRMPRCAQCKCTCSIKKKPPDVSISWISEEEYILPPLNLLQKKKKNKMLSCSVKGQRTSGVDHFHTHVSLKT